MRVEETSIVGVVPQLEGLVQNGDSDGVEQSTAVTDLSQS